MSNTLKQKLKKIVGDYKRMYPKEYKEVTDDIKMGKKNNIDKFASTRKKFFEEHAIQRKLFELPEVLFTMIDNSLSYDEKKEYDERGSKLWFAKTFKEFASADVI